MFSYTRDALLFNYDYKMDLQKCAVERDRIFVLSNIREDTEESDEEGYFDKLPEGEIQTEPTPAKNQDVSSKPETKTAVIKNPVKSKFVKVEAEDDSEEPEFPEEMPG